MAVDPRLDPAVTAEAVGCLRGAWSAQIFGHHATSSVGYARSVISRRARPDNADEEPARR
jgi:hypothetical protein